MECYKNLLLEQLTCYDPSGNYYLEQWADIKDYYGYYQISSFGRLRSLDRITTNGHKRKGRLIKIYKNTFHNYCEGKLHKGNKVKNCRINVLVATAFIVNPENKLEVNHKDGNKLNNCTWNLEWNTRRENETHYYLGQDTTSEYTGVYWNKKKSKWCASIRYKNNTVYLGQYSVEIYASDAYQKALIEIEKNTFNKQEYVYSSKYKGVTWDKKNNKWMSTLMRNTIKYNLGRFNTEIDAHNARENKLAELNSNNINL